MRGAFYCLFATNFNNFNTISKYRSTNIRFYIPYDINYLEINFLCAKTLRFLSLLVFVCVFSNIM